MKDHYLIDGNNLIGKIPAIAKIHKQNPQSSRELLHQKLSSYFASKNVGVTIYFDGFENIKLGSSKIRIDYSNNRQADDNIRAFISHHKSPTHLILISSDRPLAQFAKKCTCKVIASEDFAKQMNYDNSGDDEEKKINKLSQSNKEFIDLFKGSKK